MLGGGSRLGAALVQAGAGQVRDERDELLGGGGVVGEQRVDAVQQRLRLLEPRTIDPERRQVAEGVDRRQPVAVRFGDLRGLLQRDLRCRDIVAPVARDPGHRRRDRPPERRRPRPGAERLRQRQPRGADVTRLERAQRPQERGPRRALAAGRAAGVGEQRLDLGQAPAVEGRPYARQPQSRVALDELGGQARQPARHRRELAAVEAHEPVQGDELGGRRQVPGGEAVVDGVLDVAARTVPRGGARVQLARVPRPLDLEHVAQDLAEEVVVAVPAAMVVEGDQRQVRVLEPLEAGRAVLAAGHDVAQRRRQALEDRGLEQEVAGVGRLAVEHLGRQVVDELAVVACERGDERVGLGAAAQREPGELQPRRPALGAVLQLRDLPRREVQPERAVEQRGRLGVAEAQLSHADLDELPARAQAPERQRRIGARGDRQVHRGRQVLEQEGERLVHPRVGDEVQVIEHEHERRAARRELVDEQRHDHVGEARVGRAQRGLGGPARGGVDGAHGGDNARPEADGVVLGVVERQPGERPLLGGRGRPEHEQRGLARPRRRGDERQLVRAGRAERRDQIAARHEVGAPLWRLHLGRAWGESEPIRAPSPRGGRS